MINYILVGDMLVSRGAWVAQKFEITRIQGCIRNNYVTFKPAANENRIEKLYFMQHAAVSTYYEMRILKLKHKEYWMPF